MPEGKRLETLGLFCIMALFGDLGVWVWVCCCWRFLPDVITDAGSHPELVTCVSHCWSSGLVTVMIIGADALFCPCHCAIC